MHEKASTAAAAEPGVSPLVSASELVEGLGEPDLRVIDARFELIEPAVGPALYAAGHVPGAVYLNLDRDLADAPGRRGRHPLPDLHELARKLGASGIGRQHRVVVYDQDGGMYAARAWWLLRYMGHEHARFLDGGYGAYEAAGGAATRQLPAHEPTTFEVDVQRHMVMELEEVLRRLSDPGLVLLDARSPERYRGHTEPLDPRAGHVPGAINLPYASSTGPAGMLAPDELRGLYELDTLPRGADLVAYCGSGVSAAQLVLALEVAGRGGVKLYPGSWSEWSRRDDLPVAVGDEVPRT